MDTDQQNECITHVLLTHLRSAIRGDQPYSKIEPYATPSLLRIADAEGKRALHWAIEHHNDPRVVKLVISRDPEALVSQYNDRGISHFMLHHSNSPHCKLIRSSWIQWKTHDYPRLIHFCGTSPALEALDAAHSDEDLPLRVLCFRELWDKVVARIKQLPPAAAVAELFGVDELGWTALQVSVKRSFMGRCWRACSV